MGLKEVYNILELREKELIEEIQSIKSKEEKLVVAWDKAMGSLDIAKQLGLSIQSVSTTISKLIIRDEIIEVRNKKNLLRRKYLVNSGGVKDVIENKHYLNIPNNNKLDKLSIPKCLYKKSQ